MAETGRLRLACVPDVYPGAAFLTEPERAGLRHRVGCYSIVLLPLVSVEVDGVDMTTSFAGEVLAPARLDPVRLAAAAYLARFKGQTRVHTESDLRAYLI